MNYLPYALLAYFFNSISVTIDKVLLTKTIPDPLIYIFYFSLLSLLSLLAMPFTHLPSLYVVILASSSTLFWTFGAYLMFWALKTGQVQRVIPVIGTLTPLFLLIIAQGSNSISTSQSIAIIILIAGLILLTLPDWGGKFTKKELLLEILSSGLFALNYFLLRIAFLNMDFLTVFVWTRPILIPLGIIILIVPNLRRKILQFSPGKIPSIKKIAGLFALGQISAGFSELLLLFSISLANPAIVNSLQGIKYIFLLIFSLILGKKYPEIFKNRLPGKFLLSQIAGIGLIAVGLYMLITV